MKVLREYLDYIEKSKKLSKNTVASYNRDLKKYLDYLNSNNIDISDVVENDMILETKITINPNDKDKLTLVRYTYFLLYLQRMTRIINLI